jgi:beta-RFAP synthase
MRDCATVSVAARLHFGFLDLHGGLGRRFGSLGLALDEPHTSLEIARAPDDAATGPQSDRAACYLDRLVEALGLPGGHSLVVHCAIPEHAGLGSGTQLALAVAAALRRLHRLALDIEADAVVLDRAVRSGLGTAFFHEGGVALDGGRGPNDAPAPIVARLPFPEEWRVILVLDPARRGMHGRDELAAFKALPPFPAELAAHLCRLAVMKALPGLAEHDLGAFGSAVTEIQAHIGDHFRAVQGGRFASPAVAETLEALAGAGARGFGQSSWGPTGFAFASSLAEARRLQAAATAGAAARGLELMVVKGRNRGATLGERTLAVQRGARHG